MCVRERLQCGGCGGECSAGETLEAAAALQGNDGDFAQAVEMEIRHSKEIFCKVQTVDVKDEFTEKGEERLLDGYPSFSFLPSFTCLPAQIIMQDLVKVQLHFWGAYKDRTMTSLCNDVPVKLILSDP